MTALVVRLLIAATCSAAIAGPALSGSAETGPTGTGLTEPADRQLLLDGFRRYHAVCSHCHGPDGLGSSFAPELIGAGFDPERYRSVIRLGTRGQLGVMPGYEKNPDVMGHLDAIIAYLGARNSGALGRGRPD